MSDRLETNGEPLEAQLALFGISSVEAKIYLYLVGRQPESVLQISRGLELPRTSVYDSSTKLVEKGLLQRIIRYKSQQFRANSLESLQYHIDQEKARTANLQKRLTILRESLAHNAAQPAKTEVRYSHGANGIRQMMWNDLKATEEIYVYAQFGKVDVVGESSARRHIEEMRLRGLKDKIITNPRPDAIKYLTTTLLRHDWESFRQIRVIDSKTMHVAGNLSFYNNVLCFTYWNNGELVGVEIENQELVRIQRSIFEQMWKVAEPLDDYLARIQA
jgi:sugar-specific transcriptional regulator TrmB